MNNSCQLGKLDLYKSKACLHLEHEHSLMNYKVDIHLDSYFKFKPCMKIAVQIRYNHDVFQLYNHHKPPEHQP